MAASAAAQDADALAQQLSNPVASLISVPFQGNVDFGAGPDGNGVAATFNIQPVVPFTLNDDWNLISRIIVPVRWKEDIFYRDVFGVGDVTQSLFLSPKAPGPGGLIWGVGPVFVLPTATDKLLGADRLAVGPTAVGLFIKGPLTVGVLPNHAWSIEDDRRSEISSSFVQPFVTYSLDGGQTVSLNVESSYDWNAEMWASAPLNVAYNKVFAAGG